MEDKKKYLYIMISACGIAGASVGICMNTAGLFYTTVSADLGAGRSAVSLSTTILTIVTSLTAMASGRLLKKIGLKKTLWLSVILMCASTSLYSLCANLPTYYLLSALRGLGVGLSNFVLVTTLINNWFRRHHGTFTSLAMMFSGIPGLFLSPLYSRMITSFGWRYAYIFVAVTVLLFDLPALFLPISVSPHECGLEPYGKEEFDAFVKENPQHSIVREDHHFHYASREFIIACLYVIFVCVAAQLSTHFPALAESKGFSVTDGAMVFSWSMAGSVLCKLFFGSAADRFGDMPALCGTALISGLSVFLLLQGRSLQVLEAGALFSTFTAANSSVGISLLVSDLFGTSNYSKAYPLISFIGSLTGAISGTFFGLVYDLTMSYTAVLVIVALIQGMVILTVLAAFRLRKNPGSGERG